MKRAVKKTNPRLLKLISMLYQASSEHDAKIWRDIAKRLDSPGRNYAEVNISKISRYAQNGDIILVPGKVLGTGVLSQAVDVVALNFSKSATSKIEMANGTCMSIEELLQDNPQGSRVRILR